MAVRRYSKNKASGVGQYSSLSEALRIAPLIVRPREKLNELMRAAARMAILPGCEPIASAGSAREPIAIFRCQRTTVCPCIRTCRVYRLTLQKRYTRFLARSVLDTRRPEDWDKTSPSNGLASRVRGPCNVKGSGKSELVTLVFLGRQRGVCRLIPSLIRLRLTTEVTMGSL